MTKLKSEQKVCPTRPLRVRAWVWTVVQVICRGQPRPSFAAMEIPLMHAISTLKGKSQAAAVTIIPPDTTISASRWQGWWTGQFHPAPKYVELMEYLAPGSSRILNSQLHPRPSDPYVMQLLFALDRWAEEPSDERALFEIVRGVSERWRPRCCEKGSGSRWEVTPLPDYAVPPDTFLMTYRVLEPSSIINFMLQLTGDAPLAKNPSALQQWAFDLVAAALATDALLRQKGLEAIGQGGRTEDALTAILFVFFSYITTIKIGRKRIAALGQAVMQHQQAGACYESFQVLPETANSIATRRAGIEAFQSVLADAGLAELAIDMATKARPDMRATLRRHTLPNGRTLRWRMSDTK